MTPNDVKIVADNIDDFIEVPDGIERLRKAVLTLAVAGKLVPQDKKEGTAEDLYAEIQAKRFGSKKKRKEFVSILASEDVPFGIPSSWKWVPLPEIYTSITPPDKLKTTAMETEGKWPVIDQGEKFISGYTSSAKPIIADIPMVIFGDHTLNVKFVDFDFVAGADGTKILKPTLVYPKYLFLLVQQFKPQSRGYSRHFKQLNQKVVPLPPSGEQKRIVAKVEELMKQLEELETKKQERDEIRTRLARSAMQSLGKGEPKIVKHLGELVKTPADIRELEGALLTLAVSGKLLAQDKKDGSVRRAKATSEYGEEFNVPKSWAWFQLNDVCTFKYGYTDSAKETGTARFVRITDMGSDGNLIPDDQRYVDLSPESEKYLLSEGDLLTARIGATFGRTIIFREKYKAVFASYLIRMSFEQDFILPEYYWVFSKSGLYWDQAHSLVSGSAQPQFNANLIKKMYLPVPPIAEQKRIVKKVEEVMVLINRLKQVVGKK